MQQLMLEKLSGTSSRLPVHVVPFPELNITGIRDPGPLARWYPVMPSSSRSKRLAGQHTDLPEAGASTEVQVRVLQFRMILKDNCCNGHGI